MNEPESTPSKLRGSCLCGAVAYEITQPANKFVHCHCERCRKATGAAHASNLYLDPNQLQWLRGEGEIVRFSLPTAQSFARWFCGHCGSPVPRVSRSGRNLVVPAGSLDDQPNQIPQARIFCDSEAPWVCRGIDLPRYDVYPPWW